MSGKKNVNIIRQPIPQVQTNDIKHVHQHRIQVVNLQFQVTLYSQHQYPQWKYSWQIHENALQSDIFKQYYNVHSSNKNESVFNVFLKHCLLLESRRLSSLPLNITHSLKHSLNNVKNYKCPAHLRPLKTMYLMIEQYTKWHQHIPNQSNIIQLARCYVFLYTSINKIKFILQCWNKKHNIATIRKLPNIVAYYRQECEKFRHAYNTGVLSQIQIKNLQNSISQFHMSYTAYLMHTEYIAILITLMHHPLVAYIDNQQDNNWLKLLSKDYTLPYHYENWECSMLSQAKKEKVTLLHQIQTIIQYAAVSFQTQWPNWRDKHIIAYFVIQDISKAETFQKFFQVCTQFQLTGKMLPQLHTLNLEIIGIHEMNTQQLILEYIKKLPSTTFTLQKLPTMYCYVCTTRIPNVLFLPCKHIIVCFDCFHHQGLKCNLCIYCKQQIQSNVLVYRAGF